MKPGDMFNIPNFLKAKTAIALQQAMLSNNLEQGKEYHYFDIQYVNGNWYAWYFESVEQNVKGRI